MAAKAHVPAKRIRFADHAPAQEAAAIARATLAHPGSQQRAAEALPSLR
jgi:hypothetical protein